MTDSEHTDHDSLPNELPPVEPPSAGFILQLFLIPALIIGAIVGIVFVFGMMASSQEDWRTLVQDIGNPNPQVRWRAAMGLAQILPLDEKQGEAGENLVANRQVAEAMRGLLNDELSRQQAPTEKAREEQVQTQAFLARAVQLLRVPDVVVPSLVKAIDIEHDTEVRKNGLAAIAILANRAEEAGQPLQTEYTDALVEKLIDVSAEMTPAETAPLMRQMSAFALGTLKSAAATERLKYLLHDPDRATRANAMIGLARNNDASGYPVLVEILKAAGQPLGEDDDAFESFAAAKNAIAAIERLQPNLTDGQRAELRELLTPIAKEHSEPRLRLDAEEALKTL